MYINPLKSAASMGNKMYVSSVLSPILSMLPYCFGALILVSWTGNVLVQIFFVIICSFFSLVILSSYIFVLFFGDPNLLRSERHVYKMKALEVFGDQGVDYEKIIDAKAENNPTMDSPKNVKIPRIESLNNSSKNNE